MGAATESTFGNKLSGGHYRKKHCRKPWFDCRIAKRELRFWLKVNPDPHACRNPTLKECDDDIHILEMGTWESSATPKNSELDCRGQNTLP
jgi:hypothetical protein